jgi:hypothetical protein
MIVFVARLMGNVIKNSAHSTGSKSSLHECRSRMCLAGIHKAPNIMGFPLFRRFNR